MTKLLLIVSLALFASAAYAVAPDHFQVEFQTTVGGGMPFTVDVDRSKAPHGVDRFYDLVTQGFFNDAAFFRVVPGFVVQWGLSSDPSKNAAWEHQTIPDDPVAMGNTPGTITFATAGPNTRTTQLFINFGNNRQLDGMGFSPFGRVTPETMDVVRNIFSEYGEEPDQGAITTAGSNYLRRNFPKLDYIRGARIKSVTPAEPPVPPSYTPAPPVRVAPPPPARDDYRQRVISRRHRRVIPKLYASEEEDKEEDNEEYEPKHRAAPNSVEELKELLARGENDAISRVSEEPHRTGMDADHLNMEELGLTEDDAKDDDAEEQSAKMAKQLKTLDLIHKQILMKKAELHQREAALDAEKGALNNLRASVNPDELLASAE